MTTRFALLALVLLVSIILPVKSDNDNTQTIQRITNGTIPSRSPLPSITIVPNATQQLSLSLISSVETIVFTFLADPYDPGDYRIVITNNDKIKSSQTAQFLSGQIITFSLNTKKNLFSMTGDGVFRISQSVASKQYSFIIQEEILVNTNTTSPSTASKSIPRNINAASALYILAGIVGGLVGVTVIVKIVISVIHRRKRTVLPQTRPNLTVANERLSRLRGQMMMNVNVSPSLISTEKALGSPGYKGSINLDEKVFSDQETEYLHPYGYKKEVPNSISSIDTSAARATTASTLSKISSAGSMQTIGRGSLTHTSKSDLEDCRKSKRTSTLDPKLPGHQTADIQFKVAIVPELEAIKEESSPQRKATDDKPTEKLTFSIEAIRAKERASTTRRKTKYQVSPFSVDESKPEITTQRDPKKKFTYAQSQTRSTIVSRTIFSEDCVEERQEKEQYTKRYKPRQKMLKEEKIRKIVDAFLYEQEQEREKGKEYIVKHDYSSEDEDDEDPFQLPNYMCCMICLRDKRNIIMQPCQHIFACKSCSKKVMNTSRICLLCSGTIRKAHKLKD